MRSGTSVAAGWTLALASLAGLGLPGVCAGQQQVFVSARTSGPGGGGYEPISPKSLEGYAETLGLDEMQREAAQMLLEGYREAVREAQDARRSSMEQSRLEFEDTRDAEAMVERMQASGQAFRQRTEELERAFFGDLKSLLMDAAQEAQWPRVERARRRETQIDSGPVSTANVDVTQVVREVGRTYALSSETAEALDRYELQLDSLLAERQRAVAEMEETGDFRRFDPARLEQINELMEDQREIALRIRQLNDSVIAQVESLLGEEARGAVRSAYERAKFPRIYRESHTSRLLAAAAGFEDLAPGQREAISAMRAQYDSQAASLNARWARELAEAEKSGQESSGAFQIRFGGEEEGEKSDLEKARQARRDLDTETEQRLRDTLSDAQEERLPQREAQQERGVGEVMMLDIRGGG
ncbi:MAG: hypothetical protein ACF8R7_04625 [Phycisphaerales bacterium JB039]